MVLPQLIGHRQVVKTLSQLLVADRIPHALLFSGPPAVGKRLAALHFAEKLFVHFDPGRGEREKHGVYLSAGTHPDCKYISPLPDKRDISAEQIRELISSLSLKSYLGSCRVAIIDSAHRMSQAASNALLKTLEEPGDNVFLILITESPHLLPFTVLSRTQSLHFSVLALAEVEAVLTQLLAGEPDEVTEINLRALAELANHSLDLLELGDFRNEQTGFVENSVKLIRHLENFRQRAELSTARIKSLLQTGKLGEQLTAVAEEFADKESTHRLFWSLLYAELRAELRDEDVSRATSAARLLERVSEVESLILRRNLTAALQLSAAMVG